ncbi:MAG: diguanylate cyclase [Thermoleophilaceae bacterium]|nr:diguanylate cyclase [Thermoleophilaceae bacterium]
MVLRRRVGMRDWLLAVIVVTLAQITGVNAIAWTPFFILLAVAAFALSLWGFVFPRLAPANALTLEAWMNAGTALAAAFLVAVSSGPESPYIFFYALLIVFVAAFVETSSVRVALIALASICALAPIAYDWDEALSSDFIPTIFIAVAVWLVAAALIALKRVSATNVELEARRLGYVDQLTGAANRRAVGEYADQLTADNVPYALTIVRDLGIDEINRTMGHFVGDDVMRRVVAAMRDASLDIDQVARLGGAEFAVILPGSDLTGAERWRTRFHERLEIANASAVDGSRVSGSAGCAASVDAGSQLSEVLAVADADAETIAERSVQAAGVPARPAERAERLRAQMESQAADDERPAIVSVDAPTGALISIPAAAIIGLLVAETGGAASVLFSLAILMVAYFATFGSRRETLMATVAMMVSSLVAVIANTPVSNTEQTRALTILVAIAVVADTVERNSRKLMVSELRAAELSLVDPLTGLSNRTAFERDLQMMMPRSATAHQSRELRLDGPPAVIALDLADFQFIRQRLGHSAGDLLLVEVAEALRDALADIGTVYRIGGDEYATIIRSHHMQHVDFVGARCADAIRALDGDARYANQGVAIEFHVGGSIWSEGMTAADLAADAISHQATTAKTPGFEPVAG